MAIYFRFSEIMLARPPKSLVDIRRPVPPKGRFAIVTSAGRDAVDAEGAPDEGAGCGRRSRMVLTPQRLASSSRKATFAGDGVKQARSPGRVRISRKPLCGECRVIPVYSW